MSSELISALASMVLSLALSYTPGLKTKWEELQSDQKRFVMFVLLVVVATSSYYGACSGYWAGECGNWQAYAQALIAALVAIQSVFKLTKG